MDKILKKLEEIDARLGALENKNKEERKDVPRGAIHPDNLEVDEIGYAGRYESESGRVGATFGVGSTSIKKVLKRDSFELAKTINAFASEERVEIVKALLNKSQTANELMERLGFSSTGKLYHHLSFLEKIGVINKKDDKYGVVGRFIGSILVMFTAADKIIKNNETA